MNEQELNPPFVSGLPDNRVQCLYEEPIVPEDCPPAYDKLFTPEYDEEGLQWPTVFDIIQQVIHLCICAYYWPAAEESNKFLPNIPGQHPVAYYVPPRGCRHFVPGFYALQILDQFGSIWYLRLQRLWRLTFRSGIYHSWLSYILRKFKVPYRLLV